MSRRFAVYVGGIVALGILYEPIQGAAPHPAVFLIGAVAYLLLLRALGEFLERL